MRWRREAVTTAVWSQLRHTADCTHTSSRFRFFFFSFFIFGLKPISGKDWIRSIQTQIVNPCNRFENIYNKKKINVFIETSLTSHVISPPPCAPPLHLSFLRSPSCNNIFIYSNLLCRFFYSADAEQKQKHGLIFFNHVWRNIAGASCFSTTCRWITLQLPRSVIGGRAHVTPAPLW